MTPVGLFVIVFLIVLSAGCAGTKKNCPGIQLRSQQVQKTLGDIVEALETYKKTHGFFPKGMATLRDGHYLSIMPDVEREWTLKYYIDGGEILMVEAVSVATMPDGEGYKLIHNVLEGSWGGYGITTFP